MPFKLKKYDKPFINPELTQQDNSDVKVFDNGNCPLLTQLYGYAGRDFSYKDYNHIEDMVNLFMGETYLKRKQKEINVLKERLEEIRMITRRVYHG